MSDDALATAAHRARQDEWARHARERHAMVTILAHALEELETQCAIVKGVLEHMRDGDWLRSPDDMAALRERAAATPVCVEAKRE